MQHLLAMHIVPAQQWLLDAHVPLRTGRQHLPEVHETLVTAQQSPTTVHVLEPSAMHGMVMFVGHATAKFRFPL
jgi:hypothetical protein